MKKTHHPMMREELSARK